MFLLRSIRFSQFSYLFRLSSQSIALLLLALATGCTPPEYREVGKLLDQKTSTVGSYKIQTNLHEIKGHSQKEIWVWCQTDRTTDLILSHQLSGNQDKAAFTQIGWKRFLIDSTTSTTIPDDYVRNYLTFVDDRVVYGSSRNAIITFDSCETTSVVSPDIHFGARLNNKIPSDAKPFFKRFNLSGDGSGGCFEVDSLYLKDQETLYQLCTLDRGKTWSATTATSKTVSAK